MLLLLKRMASKSNTLGLVQRGVISHETTEVGCEKLRHCAPRAQGKPVTTLRWEHRISQPQYYQWWDQFLARADKAFEVEPQTRQDASDGDL